MAEDRKRKHDDDDDDDDEPLAVQRNSYGVAYLTSTGVVTRLKMGVVSWKNHLLEQLFESVIFATDFGAQMAVGMTNGQVSWYRHIGDMEPVQITGWPALDIIGFCVVGEETHVWIAATQDPALTLLQWSSGSALVPSGGRYSTHNNTLYVWHLFDDRLQCYAVDTMTLAVTMHVSESLGPCPLQLMPAKNTCNVLRFGAPSCQVLSTGEVFVLQHCPYVGADLFIYVNGQNTGVSSPFGPVPQWIWGNFQFSYLILTAANMATFYTVSRHGGVPMDTSPA